MKMTLTIVMVLSVVSFSSRAASVDDVLNWESYKASVMEQKFSDAVAVRPGWKELVDARAYYASVFEGGQAEGGDPADLGNPYIHTLKMWMDGLENDQAVLSFPDVYGAFVFLQYLPHVDGGHLDRYLEVALASIKQIGAGVFVNHISNPAYDVDIRVKDIIGKALPSAHENKLISSRRVIMQYFSGGLASLLGEAKKSRPDRIDQFCLQALCDQSKFSTFLIALANESTYHMEAYHLYHALVNGLSPSSRIGVMRHSLFRVGQLLGSKADEDAGTPASGEVSRAVDILRMLMPTNLTVASLPQTLHPDDLQALRHHVLVLELLHKSDAEAREE